MKLTFLGANHEVTGSCTLLEAAGQRYLIGFVIPNFTFHCTTAYGLLRHAGVPLGKADYLGAAGQG